MVSVQVHRPTTAIGVRNGLYSTHGLLGSQLQKLMAASRKVTLMYSRKVPGIQLQGGQGE